MKCYRCCIIAFFSFLTVAAPKAQADVIAVNDKVSVQPLHIPRVHAGTSPFYNYVVELLQMTMDVTSDQYGKAVLVANAEPTVQERQLRNLQDKYLDVTWSVTSFERERYSQAVYVPIAAGLFGKRLAIIRKNDLRFNSPLPLNKLQKLIAVQEESWPDTTILRSSGFNVIGAPYLPAFKMLKKKFVDYYPRGVLEIGYELENPLHTALTLEPHLVIVYPSAMFFFVSKNNILLAERLEKGLNLLIENGKLQHLLHSQEFYQHAQEQLKSRVQYIIPNPLLSDAAQQAYQHYIPLISKQNYLKREPINDDLQEAPALVGKQ
ncbi:amino acid ABC transporter substrate-binding protein [Alteromonas pelagimontana]|uniref:Amino acid ABC transporter substrate-binding protein n=1 Tax=Alteromonas pelagimontana TaxID=1858656 RepID=A0A6M4MFW6_9ALTE|nr:hypothetical protein [Alteromonas pelagimontana]QJR81550.1 amino acid ABC transporter substrate-binding protein [Alteromonas pelagimontana]